MYPRKNRKQGTPRQRLANLQREVLGSNGNVRHQQPQPHFPTPALPSSAHLTLAEEPDEEPAEEPPPPAPQSQTPTSTAPPAPLNQSPSSLSPAIAPAATTQQPGPLAQIITPVFIFGVHSSPLESDSDSDSSYCPDLTPLIRQNSALTVPWSLDGRCQLVALSMGSHPRCGAHSPVRLLNAASGHLLRRLWDDWFVGTAEMFLAMTWKVPSVFYQIAHPEPCLAEIFSFGVSRLTLGITTSVFVGAGGIDIKWIDWNKYVTIGKQDGNVYLCAKPEVTTLINLSDGVSDVNSTTLAVSSEMVAFGGVSTTTSRNVLAIAKISPYRRLIGKSKLKPAQIPIPNGFHLTSTNFLLGELVVTLAKSPPPHSWSNNSEDLQAYWFLVVPTQETHVEKMMALATYTRIALPTSKKRISALLRMRKQSGECTYIIGAVNGATSVSSILEVPEGKEVQYSDMKYISVGTHLSQINDSLFCLAAKDGNICEVWDCNISRPLRFIQLQFTSSPHPCYMTRFMWRLLASHGFIFHFVDQQLYVFDAATGATVLLQDVPGKLGEPNCQSEPELSDYVELPFLILIYLDTVSSLPMDTDTSAAPSASSTAATSTTTTTPPSSNSTAVATVPVSASNAATASSAYVSASAAAAAAAASGGRRALPGTSSGWMVKGRGPPPNPPAKPPPALVPVALYTSQQQQQQQQIAAVALIQRVDMQQQQQHQQQQQQQQQHKQPITAKVLPAAPPVATTSAASPQPTVAQETPSRHTPQPKPQPLPLPLPPPPQPSLTNPQTQTQSQTSVQTSQPQHQPAANTELEPHKVQKPNTTTTTTTSGNNNNNGSTETAHSQLQQHDEQQVLAAVLAKPPPPPASPASPSQSRPRSSMTLRYPLRLGPGMVVGGAPGLQANQQGLLLPPSASTTPALVLTPAAANSAAVSTTASAAGGVDATASPGGHLSMMPEQPVVMAQISFKQKKEQLEQQLLTLTRQCAALKEQVLIKESRAALLQAGSTEKLPESATVANLISNLRGKNGLLTMTELRGCELRTRAGKIPDSYCVIRLVDTHSSAEHKTKTCNQDSNPLWGDNISFEVPPTAKSLRFEIMAHTRLSVNELIGSFEFPASDFLQTNPFSTTVPLQCGGTLASGKLFVKWHYKEPIARNEIFCTAQGYYNLLCEILSGPRFLITAAVCETLITDETTFLTLVRLLNQRKQVRNLIQITFTEELSHFNTEDPFFYNKDSVPVKLIFQYFRYIGYHYLQRTLEPLLNAIIKNPLYPMHIVEHNTEEEQIALNIRFCGITQHILHIILKSIASIPLNIKLVLCDIKTLLEEAKQPAYPCIISLFFRLFICTAIRLPNQFHLCPAVTSEAKRVLSYFSKLVSAIVDQSKEVLTPLKPFLSPRLREELNEFLVILLDPNNNKGPDDEPHSTMQFTDYTKLLAVLLWKISLNRDQIHKAYHTRLSQATSSDRDSIERSYSSLVSILRSCPMGS
ncbi:hypothetical protein Pelo_14465 [Pelomyxa schiedti]|nr:hypothetical protein Pelo_14465 [Pelomyxa schiedti]